MKTSILSVAIVLSILNLVSAKKVPTVTLSAGSLFFSAMTGEKKHKRMDGVKDKD